MKKKIANENEPNENKTKAQLYSILFFFTPAALANDKCRELFSDLENSSNPPLESAKPLSLTPESASNYEPETAQQNSGWISLAKAKALVREKGIRSKAELEQGRQSGLLPTNFPPKPHIAYKNSGWQGYGDFFGIGGARPKNWMPFEQAKALMRTEGIQTKKQLAKWLQSERRPSRFPLYPYGVYSDFWQSYPDFFGAEQPSPHRSKKNWMPFEQAKALMRTEGIQTTRQFNQWKEEGKRPNNFPSAPHTVYKDSGWKDYPDFFGSGWTRLKNWIPLEQAKALMRTEGIQTKDQFNQWKKEGNRPG